MTQELMKCRICSGEGFEDVFNLGEQPLANGLLTSPEAGKKYPLVLIECKNCGHVQLKHTVEPTVMFEDYCFHTASSERMVNHFCQILLNNIPKTGGVVVEIGSNDGAVLERFKQKVEQDNTCILNKDTVLAIWGIDPSENLCNEAAHERKVDVWCDFFNEDTAREFISAIGKASLIMCCNVLGHVHDLNNFVQGLALLLTDDGKLVIEVPDVYKMVEHLAFDTIYHEHLNYFSVTSVVELFKPHGLYVQSIEPQDVHGGTLRYTITKNPEIPNSVQDWLSAEDITFINWKEFKSNIESQKILFKRQLGMYKEAGTKVVGYGAAAKTTVRLNYFEIDTSLLPVVLDCTEDKQGLFIPGTFQQVVSPEDLCLKNHLPGVVVIFAWNHAKEILSKERKMANLGVVFVTPDLNQVFPD